jgi:membrane associated rhomboid family serine protease
VIVHSSQSCCVRSTYGQHSFVWNLFTSGLYEDRIGSFLLNFVAILLLGRRLEDQFGTKEYARFIGVSNLIVGVFMFLVLIVRYMTSLKILFLHQPVYGSFGIVSAMVVALKHVAADEQVTLGTAKVELKWLPSIMVAVSLVEAVIASDLYFFCQVLFGAYAGWLYIRYLKINPNRSRGDTNAQFAFATFFPAAIQPPIDKLSSAAEGLCCSCIDLRSAAPQAELPVEQIDVEAPPLPGSSQSDADRRRLKGLAALEALEQRMDAAPMVDLQLDRSHNNLQI